MRKLIETVAQNCETCW